MHLLKTALHRHSNIERDLELFAVFWACYPLDTDLYISYKLFNIDSSNIERNFELFAIVWACYPLDTDLCICYKLFNIDIAT